MLGPLLFLTPALLFSLATIDMIIELRLDLAKQYKSPFPLFNDFSWSVHHTYYDRERD